jgi:hypothetical protein
MKLHSIYAPVALESAGLSQMGEPRKTEVIFACLFELSTGTDMLNRLKKRGSWQP